MNKNKMKKQVHKKPNLNKKPNFRIDEIVLLLIIAVLAIVVSFYSKRSEPKQLDAEKITGLLMDDHAVSFASNGIVNEYKLQEFKKMDYISLKNTLQVKNDFCVYLVDENGNIIFVKGSSKFNANGIVCKE